MDKELAYKIQVLLFDRLVEEVGVENAIRFNSIREERGAIIEEDWPINEANLILSNFEVYLEVLGFKLDKSI